MSRQQCRRLLYKLGYRLVTSFVILWLAVLYPAMCEYHGLLLFRATSTHIHAQHASAPAGHSAHQHMAAHDPAAADTTSADTQLPGQPTDAAPTSPGMRHKRAPVESTLMSVLALATPTVSIPWQLPAESSFVVNGLPLTHQTDLSPPDQPPRLLVNDKVTG